MSDPTDSAIYPKSIIASIQAERARCLELSNKETDPVTRAGILHRVALLGEDIRIARGRRDTSSRGAGNRPYRKQAGLLKKQ